jgi:hydrogenase expression/formation protein HypC
MCLGIPGRIVDIVSVEQKLGLADVSGVKRQVNLACVVSDEHPVEACLGDWVLIHVGFAMSRIDAHQAALTLEVLAALGEAQAELSAMRTSAVDLRGRS